MKRVSLIFLFILLSSQCCLAQSTMKIVYFSNFAPYSWEENGKMRGILVDILEEALHKRMHVNVNHKGYPWKRAQALVYNNHADAFITVPTPERRSYTKISKQAVVSATYQIYTHKGSTLIPNLEKVRTAQDLETFHLVNYLGNGWARKKLAGLKVHWADKMDDALKMLARGRYDAFVGNSHVARYQIRKLGLSDQLVELSNVLDINTFNLCIRESSPFVYLLNEFDRTIVEMRKQNALTAVYEKYQ